MRHLSISVVVVLAAATGGVSLAALTTGDAVGIGASVTVGAATTARRAVPSSAQGADVSTSIAMLIVTSPVVADR